jgi:hypothetical protein
MASGLMIETYTRMLYTLRDPLIIMMGVISWMTFSVLNRPVSTPHDEFSKLIWWTNLGMSIIYSIMIILTILKYSKY